MKSKKHKEWRWTTSPCLTSTPFSLDSLSLVRSLIFQSPTPASLINDGCLRKSDKSILIQDKSSLHHLPRYTHNRWKPVRQPRGLASIWYCCWHCGNHHGPSRHATTHIVSYFFIGMTGSRQIPWVHASSRRWFNAHFCINTSLPIRNDVMGNNENNSQLIQLLCTFNIREKVELVCCQDCMVRHDKGDIMLTNHILHAVREGTHRVRIFYVSTLMCSFSDVLILEG